MTYPVNLGEGDRPFRRTPRGTTALTAPDRRPTIRVPVEPRTPFRIDDYMLIVGDIFPRRGLYDVDYAEALDAAHEDANGRLPHEPGYGLAEVTALPTRQDQDQEDIAA